jgi:hypothetical protein
MQNDNVCNRTFRDLFAGAIRYEIPFFQRGYAWERRQWDQLFEDITDQILPDVDGGTPLGEVEHFFGPIVVLQRKDTDPSVLRYLVIDGQQRITTVYLLLSIIKEHLEQLQHKAGDATTHALILRNLLSNEPVTGDDYERLKLYSSKGDRLPTYRALFGKAQNPRSPFYYTDVDLYQPGNNQVDEFVKYVEKKLRTNFKDVPSLWQLAGVLLDSLRIVWIPLDGDKDDPQAIFESLNDKGMPLASSELICSYLFKPLESVPDFEQLHNREWLGTIREFAKQSDFEEYLRYLFSIGSSKMVGKGRKIYVHFKNRNPRLNVATARYRLAEIHENAKYYKMISAPAENRHSNPEIAALLESISATRMDASTPFLLDVLRAQGSDSIPSSTAIGLLSETLTLLVRRKMTENPTTIYDTLFPRLFASIAYEASPIRAFQEQIRAAGVWTSDQEFVDSMVNRTLYRTRDLPFTRMILMELDKTMQSFGQLPDYSTVPTIEHVIPQTLDPSWEAYLGEDVESLDFYTKINSIGNLCLLSQPANSSAGQNPFTSKVRDYSEITALARELKSFDSDWNLAAVEKRSSRLAERARVRWAWSNV